MKSVTFLLLLLAMPGLAAAGQAAPGSSLVSDMTRDHVDISAQYSGDQITLFGAMSRPGQVIVKVRSPDESVALERKGRTGPFWLSQSKHRIDDTPGLYYLLSSAPINSLLPEAQRARYQLRLRDALAQMKVQPAEQGERRQNVQDAVLRLKRARGAYAVDAGAVRILGQRLYSTTIELPARLPLGQYQVDIYLVRNAKVVATERKQINVEEVHLEHWTSSVAANNSWTFGALFTLGMMLLGLALGVVLGRGKGRNSG
jgi:uncharacterized protein (TIGR02186 family)